MTCDWPFLISCDTSFRSYFPMKPSFFNYLDHNPARPCWNTPEHKIKSTFSFYFYISRRPYFYIRIYTIKQITRNQISSNCAHHWNNSQQFMCCREFFYFDPTDPTFLQHFIFFIPNRPTWFFCNNFLHDPSNKKMYVVCSCSCYTCFQYLVNYFMWHLIWFFIA